MSRLPHMSRLLRTPLLALLLVAAACVAEDDAAETQSRTQDLTLTVAPRVTSLLAVRGQRPVPRTYAELTTQERRAYDTALGLAGQNGVSELSCSAGGGCNEQGCWGWVV